MIVGENREAVIENIRQAVNNSDFYAKVELNDPVLTEVQSKAIVDRYLENRRKPAARIKTGIACAMADVASYCINKDTEILGAEKLRDLQGGAILTSNHFSPLENTVVRHLVKKCLHRKLSIVSQVSNFAMPGMIGFLMNHARTIPLSSDTHYMTHGFWETLREQVQDNIVLIYPEQEMWFHYRKPRPPKRGAYYFAAKLNVPVISCFVEIIDCAEKENDSFRKTRYRIHVLEVLRPDPALPVKKNSENLCDRDYFLKKNAYEQIYGKPLSYDFSPEDIAGWIAHEKDSILQ